ncbi:hypothetical protein COW36_19430 [bacterium (Candidatus Blackallbacteria) CG17_big_fil_post_rev_8_21_14_2_50_48_46]|uniref:Transmembrane protein n=1 Tax=bacterium (Candidatus Blackallbacteria) CG17_big_fil_post_rev_8_21_14_2_50_48_46 TaxID=2014261 RepID=A0A2M7G0T6_9BACT|nr:MAG: hypothetical protein COW64_25040 [bacterium (Candidatus Blackallbacteria) CG18_big_fil_WC_8_21_14_2_50_49_26]PIW15095.1 MAG: hypothetical protein COW36_19430 [bacterium (Candidatus Blackallbacteria) CG17_big_fil_post_rev_8_21_14_2_50_48_46]PIW47582.1 MAG: hypothetical protein COW20_11890 [bacterium (Candidatus Blackallbacteria) CG13_big_fil_rev_8_21_14_2_50_49_14]
MIPPLVVKLDVELDSNLQFQYILVVFEIQVFVAMLAPFFSAQFTLRVHLSLILSDQELKITLSLSDFGGAVYLGFQFNFFNTGRESMLYLYKEIHSLP